MKTKYLNWTFPRLMHFCFAKYDTFIAGGYTWARELLRK